MFLFLNVISALEGTLNLRYIFINVFSWLLFQSALNGFRLYFRWC